jgi:mono/diheme cytochrome c family protein
MKLLAILCVVALSCAAQKIPQRGEQVFAKTCATGYCHGPKGGASGAPRLAGRGFSQAYINGVVTRGVPGTGMPSFSATLSKADLAGVVAYVAALNGVSSRDLGEAASAKLALTGEPARGARLFTEATRSFGRCSTCHQVGGFGISVAAPLTQIPESVAALKALATPNVKTGTMDGESMPVLVLSEGKQGALFYDLTSVPPVERNAEPGSVKFTDGSNWEHASVIEGYSDAEVETILVYLRAVSKP